ncbi:hypothetical protein [Burkholderia plantarii]|uniref:hypothetical protein n=1 Tax=Burkholderia plantarii TaxID=41899 RepID=UPI0006D894E7|nr:hypothetical protein [Burkholderia plantarii]ALK34691.1 hypothetical protein bpln_2g24870 [Burkholderia plantarii]GLZ22308.1 hypothetical protein Bpla01_58370 [Burkholderia plantarii]
MSAPPVPRHSASRPSPPLPEHERRDLQLKHHLAFARLRADCRDPAPLAVLANVIRLAWQLRDVASTPSLALLCRRAEQALEGAFLRGAPYRLDAMQRDAIGLLLALHDAQLATLTIDRYLDAWRAIRAAPPAPPEGDRRKRRAREGGLPGVRPTRVTGEPISRGTPAVRRACGDASSGAAHPPSGGSA